MFRFGNILLIGFSLILLSSVTGQDVVEIEYFFDDDPGVGLSTDEVIVSGPANIVSFTDEILNSNGLSLGFHILHMRVRTDGHVVQTLDSTYTTYDGDGIDSAYFSYDTIFFWGSYETRLVYVDQAGSGIVVVDSIEYFFDNDPGYDQAIGVDITDNQTITDFNTIFDASGLSLGFHNLFVRAKSTDGEFGLAESQLVYVDQSGSLTINIDTVEYFFDNDPGYGQANIIDFTAGNTISLDTAFIADTLSLGFHTLFLRAKGDDGNWGLAESRLVFVDPGGASIIQVDAVEYFFDHDPGYGNGIPISTASDNLISITDILTADTLSLGFHTLFVRARSSSGEWGSAESQLVYVDLTGQVVTNITDLEYFFDVDPGYGNATTIPISPAEPNPLRKIALAAAALPEGQHVVGVRARDENGQWSTYESAQFASYGPGRELDSAALAYVFGQLGGAGWNNATNWLTGPLDTWYGVDVVNTRVDSVQLSGNGLIGEVPLEMGYVLNLKKLDLSNNFLQDTIDAELAQLSQLEILDLHNNRIDELADLSGIVTLNTVHLDTNFFDFGDLEPYVGLPTFTYENQSVINDFPTDSIAKINAPMVIDKTINGAENNFQWYLNDELINGADLEDYSLLPFLPADSGTYVLRVTNNIVTGLELVTEPYRVAISDFEEDSLALVSLYNNSGGATWSVNTNWLSGNLNTWNGVTVQNQRVTDLNLPANNLDGIVPVDFGYADTLINVDLSNNLLSDTLPNTWKQFSALEVANLANNDFVSIPNLKILPVLTTLNVEGNKLQFGDLETNLGITTFTYVPQDSIGAYRDTLFDAGTPSSLIYSVTGSNNTYQWYRADDLPPHTEAPLSGQTTDTYTIDNPVFEDEDWYRLEINSNVITDLTLTTAYVNLGISSLKRDSTALLRLYDSTNGDGWIQGPNNWGVDPIANWAGVSLNTAQDRVIGLTLPANNLDGPVPAKFRDITKIESVDLSDNEISDLPNMSFMTQLNTLDVSQNRLGFAEIEANLPLSGFVYENQKNIRIDNPVRRLQFGTDDSLKVRVSGTQNEYQWFFEQFQNAIPTGEITGANQTDYFLDSINYFSMGQYYLKVTSPLVPDLELQSDVFNMIAVTDVFGRINDPLLNPYPKGDVIVLGIVPSGPYEQLDTALVDANADYLSEDIDLGDYLLLTRPNVNEDPDFIQTYTGNSIFWVEADTLRLRQPLTEGININIQRVVEDPLIGTAAIFAVIETDFPEDARIDIIEARKRVQRVGCSIRRSVRAGRTEEDIWELYAYVESDENGEINFPELPEGRYLFNVEFPGIPMNPASDIQLDIEDGDQITLEAIISESTVTVNDLTLGLPRTVADLKLYPNPTLRGKTTLDYRIDRKIDDFELKIWTLTGQQVYQQRIPYTLGYNSVLLDVSGLKNGIYLVHLEDPGQNVMIQIRMLVEN